MPEPQETPSQVELSPATREEQPLLANLLDLYIHDFSEFVVVDLEADGRFHYPHLSLYWTDPHRRPFLIRADGKLAGFVLVARQDVPEGEPVFDIAEFFILRGLRRRGLGEAAAHQAWRRFPGRWQVRVMEANRPACNFWERAISSYLGAPVNPQRTDVFGVKWLLFEFPSAPIQSP